MRSRELEAPPFAGAGFGVHEGLVGIGERVDPGPASLEEAIDRLAARLGPKAGRMVDRFASLPEGSLVWTRTGEETYRLGRVTGPWRYLDSEPARGVGIHHVRGAEWLDREFRADQVPAGVLHTFGRGGRNFQRIHDSEAEELTAELWRQSGSD